MEELDDRKKKRKKTTTSYLLRDFSKVFLSLFFSGLREWTFHGFRYMFALFTTR